MVPWTFEIASAQGLADFIEYHAPFLPTQHRHASRGFFDAQEVDALRRRELLPMAREVGRDTWNARQALRDFIDRKALSEERDRFLHALQPATAILLARFSKRYPDLSVCDLCRHREALFVFHAPEEEEIRLLLPEIWLEIWMTHRSSVMANQYEFEKEKGTFTERIEYERRLLEDRADGIADERRILLQAMEDDIFLRGERVSIERMP